MAGDSRGRAPRKDQPYYHLLAENAETTYIAYVSEQNLLPDETGRVLGPRRGAGDRPMTEGLATPGRLAFRR